MKYAFVNGTILDGHVNMRPVDGKALITANGKIEAIMDADKLEPSDLEIIDVAGKYVMPGLINAHAHLLADGSPEAMSRAISLPQDDENAMWELYKEAEISARISLMAGITSVRAVGGILDHDTKVRDRIERGEIDGARIIACNAGITEPGGHGAGFLANVVTTPEEAVAAVNALQKENVDQIKLFITGGVMDARVKGEPGIVRMTPPVIKAACDRAHTLGYRVAAHVESPEGVRVALMNGVDTIEHGAVLDDECIALFKKQNATTVATLSAALPYALLPKQVSGADDLIMYNGNVVFHGIAECAKTCLENDIPVGLGTDSFCPFCTQYGMWRELYYFTRFVGVSPAFTLHTATEVNARILGIDSITGSLDVGKDADIIVTEENPLESPKALRKVDLVMARGKLYRNPEYETLDEIDRVLDALEL